MLKGLPIIRLHNVAGQKAGDLGGFKTKEVLQQFMGVNRVSSHKKGGDSQISVKPGVIVTIFKSICTRNPGNPLNVCISKSVVRFYDFSLNGLLLDCC